METRQYTVNKPIRETVMQTVAYNVTTPVRETIYQDQAYTVLPSRSGNEASPTFPRPSTCPSFRPA